MSNRAETLKIPEHSISGKIGAAGKWVLSLIVGWLSDHKVHPNVLTLIGLVINIFAAVLFAKGLFLWAGLVVVFAGIFDMVDGEVARRTQRVTKFGAFFDSVIDRYSDMVLLFGLVYLYSKNDSTFYMGLAVFVIIGSLSNRMAAVLWVLAVLSNWAVAQRIFYTWQEGKAIERGR